SSSASEETVIPLTDEVDLLKKQEQKLIASVMKQTDNDRARAALILGISPTTLWRKMRMYGVENV
uniref:helix-turn-helix domain-containing protein n=2 Tax=Enterobacteriaceae TaxID=543 RepID=UPI0021486C86